jgi:hypothetical protein
VAPIAGALLGAAIYRLIAAAPAAPVLADGRLRDPPERRQRQVRAGSSGQQQDGSRPQS